MNSFWNQAPFIRILFPFLAGILITIYSGILKLPFEILPVLLITALTLLIVFIFSRSYIKNRWLPGLAMNLLLSISGSIFTIVNTDIFTEDHFKYQSYKDSYLIVQLNEALTEKEKSYKTVAEVKNIIANGKTKKTRGQLLIYIKKDSAAAALKYGDQILISGKNIIEIPPPKNPHQFNYKKYLEFHNIYYQNYLSSGTWKKTGINNGNTIIRTGIAMRDYFLQVLKPHFQTLPEYAVASALILGYRDDIDDTIVQAYSNTGAMHVLSVSGMHVSIIYLVLELLLKFLNKTGRTRLLKAVFIITFLWVFALISGLSPAVLRAATMFTFVVVGQTINRKVNIYNTLAASAFFLLCINPYLIMDVGFQLSYLAVIGIVYLQPKIYKLWLIKNSFFDKVWAVTAVSMAAQIITFPLSLLYFHQFPVLFFISNLIVIPVASIILYGGIALFFLSWVPLLSFVLGKILYYSTLFLNKSLLYMQDLPLSLIEGISISIIETWLIYGFMAAVLIFLVMKKIRFAIAAICTLLVLSVYQSGESITQKQQKKFIVYNTPKTSTIEFIDGCASYFLSQESLLNNEHQLLFHIKHNWWEHDLNNTQKISINNASLNTKALFIKDNYIQFDTLRVTRIKDQNDLLKKPVRRLQVNYIILSENAKVNVKDVANNYIFDIIIFDTSNSRYKEQKWKIECNDLKLNCYSVSDSGAFVKKLR